MDNQTIKAIVDEYQRKAEEAYRAEEAARDEWLGVSYHDARYHDLMGRYQEAQHARLAAYAAHEAACDVTLRVLFPVRVEYPALVGA